MKILINCIGLKSLFGKKGGAIQKLIIYQLCNLQTKYNITIIGDAKNSNKAGIKIIEYSKIPKISSIKSFIYYGICNFLKFFYIDCDVIISTHQRNFFSSFLYSQLRKKTFIAWELDHEFWVPPITKVKRFYYYLAKKTDKIIAISTIQKKRKIQNGIHPAKIEIIYNAIDTNKYKPLKNNNYKKYLLYVAKFTKRKNQLTLLRAFQILINKNKIKYSKLQLILVGPSSGAFSSKHKEVSQYYQKCINFINESLINDKVIILENINDDDLISLYQQATLFVFPSLEEGFGMSLLEAMACGCPCIANNIEPMSEVLGPAGWLVNIENLDELIIAIETLLNNDELRQQLSCLARQRAISLFDITLIGKQFSMLLNNFF